MNWSNTCYGTVRYKQLQNIEDNNGVRVQSIEDNNDVRVQSIEHNNDVRAQSIEDTGILL